MSYKTHISELAGKVRKLAHIMYRIREAADPQTARLVYTALCESIISYCINSWGGSAVNSIHIYYNYIILVYISYCINSWGGSSVTNMLELERAQRTVLKVLFGKKKRFPTQTLYSQAGVLTVRQIYILKTVLIQHKAVMKNNIYKNSQSNRLFKIPLPTVSSTFAQRFTHFLGPYMYNNILTKCDIKQDSLYKAKLKLNSWLWKLSYAETEKIIKIVQ
ncbi:hypothetical protein RR48_09029 [Papilio machaon]|uniref:Uncharacterized protein n=1 Tax=Papilio machaon TaxID=76193 RepID=A0A194RBL5_PAPMA|nr:hypothetical protein RR48_09029 [Papilio machaon]